MGDAEEGEMKTQARGMTGKWHLVEWAYDGKVFPNIETVQAACGHWLSAPEMLAVIDRPNECRKCGTAEDFDAARVAMREKEDDVKARRAAEADKDEEQRRAEREQLMGTLNHMADVLRDAGYEAKAVDFPSFAQVEIKLGGKMYVLRMVT